jgi:hypothetical protein
MIGQALKDIALYRRSKMDLSPKQIIDWFRQQSKQFKEIADSLESTFGPDNASGALTRPRRIVDGQVSTDGNVTADQVRNALKFRKMRLNKLAEKLGVSESKIRPLLTTENGIEIGERGWIKLISENAAQGGGA